MILENNIIYLCTYIVIITPFVKTERWSLLIIRYIALFLIVWKSWLSSIDKYLIEIKSPDSYVSSGFIHKNHANVDLIRSFISRVTRHVNFDNWVRLAQNGTNLGFFQIRFSAFWLTEPKCTESDLKNNSEFVPFGANLTHFGLKSDTHALLADGER